MDGVRYHLVWSLVPRTRGKMSRGELTGHYSAGDWVSGKVGRGGSHAHTPMNWGTHTLPLLYMWPLHMGSIYFYPLGVSLFGN